MRIVRSYFVGNKPLIEENAFRNSSLQAAYFILAARALGLGLRTDVRFRRRETECGISSRRQVEGQSSLHLGYGDSSKLHPRNPRLNFEEASVIL